jgi:hypothetical protein
MGFKMGAIVGLGVGYYLGAKAGRERYEQMNLWAEKAKSTDAYNSAAAKARDLADEGFEKAKDMAVDGLITARERAKDAAETASESNGTSPDATSPLSSQDVSNN